jgi:hypothetical protein
LDGAQLSVLQRASRAITTVAQRGAFDPVAI